MDGERPHPHLTSGQAFDEKLPFSEPKLEEKVEDNVLSIHGSDASERYLAGWRLHVITFAYGFHFHQDSDLILSRHSV